MTGVAVAAVLLLVGAAGAWAAFVIEGSPYTVGDDPYSLNAADFNGDGRPDVATINGTSSDVSVFLRQAGGGFAQEAGSPISVGSGSGPSGAAVGDYNGDGLVDLAVSRFVAPRRRVGAAAPAGRRLRARGRLADRRRHGHARGRSGRLQQRRTARPRGDADRQPGRAPAAPAERRLRAGAAVRDRADPGRDRRRRLQRRWAGRPGDCQPGRRQRDDPAAGSRWHVQLRGGGPGRRRARRHRRRRL